VVFSIGEIKKYDRPLLKQQTGYRASLLTQPRPRAEVYYSGLLSHSSTMATNDTPSASLPLQVDQARTEMLKNIDAFLSQ